MLMGGDGPPSGAGDKRVRQRVPVLRAAKVLWRGSVVDCLVLDISPSGLRVSTETVVPFPPEVTIEMRTGGRWTAARRWQKGVETGFELLNFAGLHGEGMSAASRLYDQLRHAGVLDVTNRLAEAKYYDHADLKQAAEDVAGAVRRLEEVLRIAAGRS